MAIQQLTQPIINPISAFDSKKAHTISFIVIGGAQVIGNRLVIRDNQTGKEIYNKIQSTMKLEHLIPANTLINGGYYNAVVYTIDSANNESVASTAVPFYCYSQPNLTIDNIPATETIENGTYRFIGSYLQKENELLNSYQYTLYDSNKNILSQSSLIYYDTDSSLSYTFVGMSNDTAYYIELSGETVNGTKITSGLKYFTVRYLQPASFAICDLVNNCENGYIQISSNIVAIDGKSNPDPPIYIDDKEVDLRDPDSWVEWNSGFRIQDDFTMRVWGRDFTPYENIITLSNDLSSSNNPNKIEMKWMIGDTIKKLPTYKDVSGYNVNLEDSQRAPIKNLSIKGETRQKTDSGRVINEGEGYVTLNPASGKNLLNVPAEYTILSTEVYKTVPISLKANHTYTIKIGQINTDNTDVTRVLFNFIYNKVEISNSYAYVNLSDLKGTYTPASDVDAVLIYSGDSYAQGAKTNTTYKNLMIYEGTDDASYEPFGYIPSNDFPCNISIIPCGNSIQETREESKSTVTGTEVIVNDTYINNQTEFNIDGNSYQETTEGYNLLNVPEVLEISIFKEIKINLKANNTYTFKFDNAIAGSDNNISLITFRNTTDVVVKNLNTSTVKKFEIQPTQDITNIRIYASADYSSSVGKTKTFQKLMIYEGTEDKPYEPYTGGIPSPSPDYPQEITNVGERGYNLLNVPAEYTILSTEVYKTVPISLKANHTYTIKIGQINTDNTDVTRVLFNFIYNKVEISNSYAYVNLSDLKGTYTPASDVDAVLIYSGDSYAQGAKTNTTYKNLMIYEGTEDKLYEPYIDGIKIKQSGKNKVDFINYAEKVFDSSKVEKLSDGSYKFKHCDTVYTLFEGLLKAPCTLSWYARNDGTTTSNGTTFNFKIFYEDGTTGTLIYTASPDFSLKTKVLTKNVIKIVNSYIGVTPLTIIKDVQLEEGSKATPYEPYHEPIITPINLQGNILSKIGNVKDILKVNRNGKVEIKKNIGKVVLDGTENWNTLIGQKGDNTSYFYYIKTDMKKASSIICNQFINRAVWSTDVEGIQSIIDNFIRLRINTSRASTVAELKAWLVAQKEAGTPVIVYYELATPQIITLPSISPIELWQGTNIFSLVTNLETEIELEYNYIPQSPSPEAPSEIRNVGNNINILDKNNISVTSGVKREILETGIRLIDIAQSKYEYTGIPLGGKELLSKNITCYYDVLKNKNIYSNVELFFGTTSSPTSGGIIQKQAATSSITWKVPSDFPNGSDQISIYLYISGENPPSSGYSVDFTNLKVEIGDTPTNYSPYGLGNISTVISNKNVFNLKRLIEMSSKYSKIENGYKFSTTEAMYSKGVSCLYPISLSISMSYKIQNLTGTGFRFKFWFDNGKTESLSAYSSGTSSEETNIVINNYTKSRCETNCKNRY